MTITINKCNGCIYYNSMYAVCSKPNSVMCPRESGCIAEKPSISIITNRCIICDNDCMDNVNMVCDECKEAIKKLKEMLKNDTK